MSRSSLHATSLAAILVVLCMSAAAVRLTDAHSSSRGRVRWPKLSSAYDSSLKTCPRVYNVKGSALLTNWVNQTGSYNLTYSFIVIGATSPPTDQSVVTGNPCDPLAIQTTLLSLPGTWAPYAYRWTTAFRLTGSIDGQPLFAYEQANYYRRSRSAAKLFVKFTGNQTFAGQLKRD